MTYEEAKALFEEDLKDGKCSDDCPECNARELAISALEKQITKNPNENRYPWAICPSCGGSVYLYNVQEHIMNNENTYCEHCGQALDWSDTE